MRKVFLITVLLLSVLISVSFSQNVSISFFQESLTQALSDLAAQENITILTDSTVGGFITLTLNNVPISEALDLMLLPGGYSWKEIKPNVYFVGTANPNSTSFLYLATSTSYQLKYISSKTLLDLLPDVMKPYVFTSTNSPSLVLIGAPDNVKSAIISLIKKVDLPKNEVVVQMNIIEIDESLLRKWGMDLQYSNPSNSSSSTTFNVLDRAINMVYTVNDLSILSNIRAKEASGAVKILANPKLRITSGNSGSVDVSTTRKYSYVNTDGKKVLANVNVGVKISLTPTVSASGDVSLNMSETVSGAMETSNPVPNTMTNTLSTVFNMRVGKTLAVGGVDFSTYEKSLAKVPVLGDIPIVGYLFTQSKMKKVKKEIVVIITCKSVGGE